MYQHNDVRWTTAEFRDVIRQHDVITVRETPTVLWKVEKELEVADNR